jgi:FkbM family methyltransferase
MARLRQMTSKFRLRHITHPARAVNSLYRFLQNRQYAQIGPYRIHLPWNSQWLNYRGRFHLQDTALGQIAAVLREKYPALHAIDIGANVGDTAALIRESGEIPVLCIEGDPVLLPLLKENVAQLGAGVVIEPSFVGPDGSAVDLASTTDLGRNASLVRATDPQGSVKLRSLRTILANRPDFAHSKLLKTDTEGFDFDIIRQSIELIQRAKPAIFFEYNPHFRPHELHAGIDTIRTLVGEGYSEFIYYDNFGNFLLHSNAGNESIFSDLDGYLGSNHRHGAAILYFDICALHHEDADLAPNIRLRTQR